MPLRRIKEAGLDRVHVGLNRDMIPVLNSSKGVHGGASDRSRPEGMAAGSSFPNT